MTRAGRVTLSGARLVARPGELSTLGAADVVVLA
jgi:hypothetical protein